MSKLVRVKVGKEPHLHTHRYVVSVARKENTKYHYCANLKEVDVVKREAAPGSLIRIYSAHHDFREAFEVQDA